MSRVPHPVMPASLNGQILVLGALLMVVLIGITGLAIDVSAAYVADRWQRSVADAAALAGGQDIAVPGSRSLPSDPTELAAMYTRAEDHAMDVLVAELKASSKPTAAACFNATGCALPDTPYVVSVQAPSPSCVDCVRSRAIQVSVRQPSFGLTFARIFGQDKWSINSTSVAGVLQTRRHGLVTLRPPARRGTAQNRDDIGIAGGSKVIISGADAASNTSLVCSGGVSGGSELRLDNGFSLFHWDLYEAWLAPPGECANPPAGEQLTSPIPDPDYAIPQRAALSLGCPTTSTTVCTYTDRDLDDAKLTAAACAAEITTNVPPQYAINPANATCYKPGIYAEELVLSANTDVAVLTPGVYFFDDGLDIGGTLIGGYQGGQPGVALVLPYCPGTNCPDFAGNNAVLVALNFGSAYLLGAPCDPVSGFACEATAAQWAGGSVETSSIPPKLMTIMVEPDPICLAAPFPFVEPAISCSNRQPQIKLPGGGHLAVAGVQYAPTDNTTVTGSSPQEGILGQIISWTITFSGDSTLNLEAFSLDELGVLRLDPACSPTVPTCIP
jgi:Putative Flp pilus-assembly TadE/G-like